MNVRPHRLSSFFLVWKHGHFLYIKSGWRSVRIHFFMFLKIIIRVRRQLLKCMSDNYNIIRWSVESFQCHTYLIDEMRTGRIHHINDYASNAQNHEYGANILQNSTWKIWLFYIVVWKWKHNTVHNSTKSLHSSKSFYTPWNSLISLWTHYKNWMFDHIV